jgi:ankyrin repeat protein
MAYLSLHPRTHLGLVAATAHNRRIAAILHEAELSPPQRIPALAELDVRDFEASLPSNIDEARYLLVQQRTSEPGYRQPDQQKRHVFRSKKSKEAKCNTANWIFTKHEVAKAFDELLSRVTLPVPGIAQALLSHASVASVEELWCHFRDPKLEKRMESRSKKPRSSALPKSISSVVLKTRSSVALETTPATDPEITWLKEVCRQENLEYIRLMCQAGLGQNALDQAFEIALSKHSMDAMEVLLSFGAVAPGACWGAIRERVKLHDVALVRLLLSAPSVMSVEAWQSCLEPEIQSLEAGWIQSPDLLLLCLAHRPEVVCWHLLLKALESQNLPATAIMLAYGRFSGDSFHDLRKLACEFASRIQDDGRRHKFFTILVESEFVADSRVLRRELVKDVITRQLPLIKLLADAGVIVDMEPHNAFSWAVSHMDFDILELFKSCKFSSPISLALKFVPDSTSESDLLRLVEILGPIGLVGEPLDSCLICAVRRRHIQLVDAMIRYGASIEFKQASAIQAALENADLELLSILLRSKCSATILSATIPTAMVLKSRPIRLQAMKALIKKGVLPQELGVPLQRLVSEDGDVDSELIQLLLQHEAPVDGVGDDANNVVLVAARRGNLSILKMLCDARPRNKTLSKAVPVAFSVMDTCGYDVTLNMIKLLLQKGAAGLPNHQTLLAAAKRDRLEIVRLLVEHGADANYSNGASFGVALTTLNFKLLQILCAKCPLSQASIESGFFLAIDPRWYTSEALELLLSSTRDAGTALNTLWSSEKLRGNPNITAIVSCLLRHGLDVNLRNGGVVLFAIREKNVVLLDRILSANPSITSLRAAFRTATYAQPRSLELDTMRLLLEKAKSAEIGQSESLLQQTHSALSGDFAGLRLLLRHKAVATPRTFTKGCLATASSTVSWNEKQEIFESLLAPSAGISTEDMSKLLAHSVTSLSEYTQLPQLLLAYGAEVKFETLKVALETSSLELLDVLLSSTKSVDTVVRAFTHARKTTMVSDRRYWIYQHLLDKGIPSDDVSEALLDSLKADDLGDLSFPKLLLEKGASPGYQNGEPFSLALRANSLFAVRLLTQYVVDDSMATVAFDVVCKTPLLKKHVRAEIYRPLLEWNISKPSISQALADSFKGGRPDISFLQLLLAKGADPNKDNGHCFAVAAKTGALAEFQALSKYAKWRVVLKVLLNNFQEEWEIVRWFKVCQKEQPRSGKIDQDELVFQCMSKFPAGTTLLKLLLDQGVSASAKMDHCLCASWKPEPCTALIWALFQKPRIENDVILVLLSRGDAGMLHVYHIVFPHD